MKKIHLLINVFVFIALLSATGFITSVNSYGQDLPVSQVAFTDRYQLISYDESELAEESKGRYAEFLKTNPPLSETNADVILVRKVGKRIAEATHDLLEEYGLLKKIKGFDFEYNVVESKSINAWCMSGGKIVVYTGILPYCREEGYMAALLGHEIAHAVAWHGNERLSQEVLVQGLIPIIEGGLGKTLDKYEYKKIFEKVFDVASDGGLLAYSRVHEYEADLIGMYIMAYAGYKPVNAQYFWQKMMTAIGSEKFDFLSTHPATAKRIEEIKENIPAAEKYYKTR